MLEFILTIIACVVLIRMGIGLFRKKNQRAFGIFRHGRYINDDDNNNDRAYPPRKQEDRTRNKGASLLMSCDDYVVIDTETTGVSPSENEIIELSAIRIVENKEAEIFTTLCRPRKAIPKFIEKMTGITNEMVADAPGISDVIGDFVSFIGNSIIIGHNINFDINFIYDIYNKTHGKPFDNDFIDTLPLARKLFPEMRHHKLGDIAKRFRIDCGHAHRSLDDCRTTHACYQKMKAHLKRKLRA